jgi:acyl-CoA thioesterase-2
MRDADELLEILDLETLEGNRFRGISPRDEWQRVFGGQVLAQALVAAERTIAGRPAHSLHAYFLRAGDPAVAIDYHVEAMRDGRSFSTRRIVAWQHGAPIFVMTASFHHDEDGLGHALAPDEVATGGTPFAAIPPPEDLPSIAEIARRSGHPVDPVVERFFGDDAPILVRPTDPARFFEPGPRTPVQRLWMKIAARLPETPSVHRAALAYLSDLTLLDTALIAYGRSAVEADMMLASLDHAMWLHAPVAADEWLLYVQDSPFGGNARSFNRGSLFDRRGRLVASVAQEGVIRFGFRSA